MPNSLRRFGKQLCALLLSECIAITTASLPVSAADDSASTAPKGLSAPVPIPTALSDIVPRFSTSGSLEISPGITPATEFPAPSVTRRLLMRSLPTSLDVDPKSRVTPLGKPAPRTVQPTLPDAGQLSSGFVENKGQWDRSARFRLKGGGKTLWLTDSGIVFDNVRLNGDQRPSSAQPLGPRVKDVQPDQTFERFVFSENFVGAHAAPRIETTGMQPGAYNYFIGNDPTKWHTNARAFSGVVYRDLWDGVDVKVATNGADIEQEFVVHPGADLSQIQVSYDGVDGLEVAKDGSLLVHTRYGDLKESAPRVFQEIAGKRERVIGHFKLTSATSYTYEVKHRNPQYALLIDPTLLYSTYLGGSAGNYVLGGYVHNDEVATGIAVDAAGDAYVTGHTISPDFPTTPGALQTSGVGNPVSNVLLNAFVTKLNPAGSGLIYSTYLNGTSSTYSTSIAVDWNGNAYVTGWAGGGSNGFPTTPDAYAPVCFNPDFFVTELNSTGNGLVYSSCMNIDAVAAGGIPYGYYPKAVAVDSRGRVYVTGGTFGSVPTTSNAYQPSNPGVRAAAFVTIFDTTASGTSSLIYSTNFGIPDPINSGNHFGVLGNGIATDSFGNIYVTGSAGEGLPTTAGAFQATYPNVGPCFVAIDFPYPPCPAAFIAKFNPSATGSASLIYSTYVGGPGNTAVQTTGNGIVVDSTGNAYITGYTGSSNFPVTQGAFQTTASGLPGAFVSKLNASGSSLIYSTFLTGNSSSSGNGIAVDLVGDAYVTGSFEAGGPSNFFPVTADAFQNSFTKIGSFNEAFLTKLNPTGSALLYSSYLGGAGDDAATGVALDQIGDAYLTGHTSSPNFPVVPGVFQSTMNGTGDAFITKFPVGATGGLSIAGILPASGGNNGTITPTVIGSGFHFGATVTLSCPSTSNLAGSNPSVSPDGRTIAATLSLVGQSPGPCTVTVTNVDGTSASLPSGFTVLQGGSADIQLDLMGWPRVVGGLPATYLALYTNRGTIDSGPFRLWISFPNFFSWSPPPDRAPASAGQLNGVIYVGFDIPSAGVGSSGWIPIQLTSPSTIDFTHRPFTVQVWSEKR